jgi:predicted nucleotidyltransferase
MDQRDYKIAEDLKERLSKVVTLLDFRVFGSRARGEADEFSDMDVFLEVECLDRGLKQRIRTVVWEVGLEHLVHISPLIFTRHELSDSPLRASPIVERIHEEGVPV